MERISNDCYIDIENYIIAVDAPTLEEARAKALGYLRELGIPNYYAFLHNMGMTDSEILHLEMSSREENLMLNGTLPQEDIDNIIYENMEPDITPLGRAVLNELFDL